MNIMDFADKHQGQYVVRGSELIPAYCPVCKGGDNGDRNTFALNLDTGVFVCKRGKCGARGRFQELANMFGEGAARMDNVIATRAAVKQYDLPDLVLYPRTAEIDAYFESRKIGPETLDAYKIQADKSANIVFPFYWNNILEYVKFRKPQKPEKGDRKEWQVKNTCGILFGMDLCTYSRPLIITEGMIDTLSLYEAGATNVVSVPGGSENLDWIDRCWEWLERFRTIVLFGDNDEPGKKMVQRVAKRLDEARCYIVEDYPARASGAFPEVLCKDANEILFFKGAPALMETLHAAKPLPLKGLIRLEDVTPDDGTGPRIRTMIPALDEAIGGLAEDAITVFTGKPGEGKSTIGGLLLLNAIEQGHSVCAYSGELSKERFQAWIHLQLAGSEFIGLKFDPVRGKQVPCISPQVQRRLMDYYSGKFFLFDNREIFDEDQATSILQVFTAAVRRYGCKLFLIDNFMTALSDGDDDNKAQGGFINMLKRFVKQYGVHVLQVAHPRKVKAGEPIRQDDIGGNSATGRLADTIVVVERPNLRIIKNRDDGVLKLITCCYCADSRRIYQSDKGDLNRFSWNREGVALPAVRADSLPEYGIQFAETEPF